MNVWLIASGCGGSPPPGSVEKTKPSCWTRTSHSLASRICEERSAFSMANVPPPTETVRMLALVLGSFTIAPPLAATIDLSTRMVDCFQSMSLQRMAQASPLRMPVAAAR